MSDMFTPHANAFRFYDDDAGEAASTALAAQDTNFSINVDSDVDLQIRFRIDETGNAGGSVMDDFDITYDKNATTVFITVPITDSGDGILAATAGLSSEAATTDRSSEPISNPGGGSFDTGGQSTDGIVNDRILNANNFTEHVWGIRLISANFNDGDTIDLEVGGKVSANNVTARLTIVKGAAGSVASGTPVMPIVEIGGTALTAYDGFGAFELPQITTIGAALHPNIADGQVVLPSIETTGVADTAYEGIGAFALPIIETDGFASSIPEASGQPIMPSITINGDAGVAYTGDGAFSLSIVEISGDANTVYDAVSAFELPIIEISGDALASAVGEASGQPILPIITIIGVANATVIASGTPVLPGIIIGGNADGGEIAVSKFVKTFTSEFTTEFTIE